jgi:hypothetical protein
MVVVVSGPPGIGKTALAVHAAHLAAAHFPGGCWSLAPDAPAPAALPPPADAPGSLFLIDDARSVEQIRHLLPVHPASAAIVTSRTSLAGLAATRGCYMLRLGAFWAEESLQLLRSALGPERVDTDLPAARALADVCGHFPFALTLAASRLLLGHRRSLADHVAWLAADPVRRLSLTADPSMSLLELYQPFLDGLAAETAHAFVTLAATPSERVGLADEFSVRQAADLFGAPETEAERLLEGLVDAGLVEIGPAGGYYVYPLLRTVARAVSELTVARN